MHKQSSNRQRRLIVSALAAVLAPPALAQGAASDEPVMLEEVIVTARRREETLQAAPYAVTAFSAETLQDANIQRMEDFVSLTPNVTLATSQGIGTSFLSIRGLTQVRNGEAPVATVIDGLAYERELAVRMAVAKCSRKKAAGTCRWRR